MRRWTVVKVEQVGMSCRYTSLASLVYFSVTGLFRPVRTCKLAIYSEMFKYCRSSVERSECHLPQRLYKFHCPDDSLSWYMKVNGWVKLHVLTRITYM